jgi:hypothetical protein
MTILTKYGNTIQIIKRIDHFNVVWFANSNQFVGFENPAFLVYKSRLDGLNRELTAQRCFAEYQTTLQESRQFVNEIFERIESVEQWKSGEKPFYEKELYLKTFRPFSTHHYRINGKYLSFRYETELHELIIHPLLKHLGTETESSEFIQFEISGVQDKFLLRVNNQIQGIWNEDETHLLKGKVFQQILNVAYDKRDDDWMAIIHASAVTNGAKTIVFAAAPGKGKSTIAALLHRHGYRLVSDDFVPIESESLNAYPFQIALSVKEGSRELLSGLYSELREESVLQLSMTNKKVQYLSIEVESVPAPVHEVVFINYNASVDFKMNKLEKAEALRMLLDETWTSSTSKNAGRFLDWYEGINCYQLTYSNTEKALNAVSGLFEL